MVVSGHEKDCEASVLLAAAKRRGNNSEGFEGFHLKATAKIFP
jgi:hypothetical protein